MGEYALRLQNGVDTMPRVRAGDALGLMPDGPMEARAGLRPDGGGDVTVNDGSMDVVVAPFMGWVQGAGSDQQGGYPFVLDAAKTLTVTDGDPSLARVDTVVAQVQDTTYDNSGLTRARVYVLQGTPGAGAPVVPDGAVGLRDIIVGPGTSTGTGGLSSSSLGADRRRWIAALGGVLPVVDQGERDGLDAFLGQIVYRVDAGRHEALTAAGWQPLLTELTGDRLQLDAGRIVQGFDFGSFSRGPALGGNFRVDHNLGQTPSVVVVTINGSNENGDEDWHTIIRDKDATGFTVAVNDSTGANVPDTPLWVEWLAIA